MGVYCGNTMLNSILTDIRKKMSGLTKRELKRYYDTFSKSADYNLAEHGRIMCAMPEVRNFYKSHGYKVQRYSDAELWGTYKHHIGIVVRQIMKERGIIKA